MSTCLSNPTEAICATLTQNDQQTVVSLSPDAGLRTDVRAFFSDEPDRIYTPSSTVFAPAPESITAVSAYDSAITGLAFAREWVYRHARNADEIGASDRAGGGPVLVVVIIVVGVLMVVAGGVNFYQPWSSSSLTALSATWKPIFEWVPSQNGFVVALPQRHSAIVSCSERNSLSSPSTTTGSFTRYGPSRSAIFACSAIVIHVSMTEGLLVHRAHEPAQVDVGILKLGSVDRTLGFD